MLYGIYVMNLVNIGTLFRVSNCELQYKEKLIGQFGHQSLISKTKKKVIFLKIETE